MRNSEIFRRAADYIREHGLEQSGSYGNHGGPRCLAGAMFSAAGVDDVAENLRDLFITICRRLRESGYSQGYTAWNDAREREATDVIAFLASLADDEELKDQIAMQASEFNDVELPLPPAVKEALPVG